MGIMLGEVSNIVSKNTRDFHTEERLIETIRHVHRVLSVASDLSPKNPSVCYALDALFSETIYMATHFEMFCFDKVLNAFDADFLKTFRELLNKAEEAMEYYWSAKIFSTSSANYNSLHSFIYWDNYVALVQKEIALLEKYGSTAGKAYFVGQGPLPMTMLIYNNTVKTPCVGVDILLRATRNAQRLSLAIDSQNCAYVHADGCHQDYTDADIVFIASLVPVKDQIIEKIKRDRGDKTTYIMVRTAEQLSRLYYEPYECMVDDIVYLGKTVYDHECINTTLLYRLNERPI